MSDVKHTSGPWTTRDFGEAHHTFLLDSGGHWMAVIQHNRNLSVEVQGANSRLIAAAPVLLAASLRTRLYGDDAPCGCWDRNAWHRTFGMLPGEICVNYAGRRPNLDGGQSETENLQSCGDRCEESSEIGFVAELNAAISEATAEGKHSPVPWKTRDQGDANFTALLDGDNQLIAIIQHNGKFTLEGQAANDRLFTAAPTLLVDCVRAKASFEQ